MTPFRFGLLLGGGIALGIGFSLGMVLSPVNGQLKIARAEASAAKAAADSAIAYADSVVQAAQQAVIEARAAKDSATKHALAAEVKEKSAKVQLARFQAVAATAPDTCAEVIFEAEKALAEAVETRDEWVAAYENEKEAVKQLEIAQADLQKAYDRLRPAAVNLSEKTGKLISASKPPGIFRRILPKPGFGVTVGIDRSGQPNVVVGATVGWGR